MIRNSSVRKCCIFLFISGRGCISRFQIYFPVLSASLNCSWELWKVNITFAADVVEMLCCSPVIYNKIAELTSRFAACVVCACASVWVSVRVFRVLQGYVDSIAMTMMTVAALQKAAESLLSSEKTDVPLLDQVCWFISIIYGCLHCRCYRFLNRNYFKFLILRSFALVFLAISGEGRNDTTLRVSFINIENFSLSLYASNFHIFHEMVINIGGGG